MDFTNTNATNLSTANIPAPITTQTTERTPQNQIIANEEPASSPSYPAVLKKQNIVELSQGKYPGRFQRLSKLLGKGANKEVYLGFDTDNNNDVAWNRMVCGEQAKLQREKEIGLLSECNHDNIIKYLGTWESENYFIFITEFFSGSLKQYRQEREVLLKSVKTWTRQILEGLAHLHQRGIIHRDIKCDNIFINQKTGDVVIGDLGLSRMEQSERSMSMVGTVPFMAPEQLDLDERHYDAKVDIYAFGMTIIELITNEFPYDEVESLPLIIRNIMENRPPNAFLRIKESEVKTFIGRCITRNPSGRPSAEELLNSEWLNNSRPEDNEYCQAFCIPKSDVSPGLSTISSGINQTPSASDHVSHIKPTAKEVGEPTLSPSHFDDLFREAGEPGYVRSPTNATSPGQRSPTVNVNNLNHNQFQTVKRANTCSPKKGRTLVQRQRTAPPPTQVVKNQTHVITNFQYNTAIRGDESSHLVETEEVSSETPAESSSQLGGEMDDDECEMKNPKLRLERHVQNIETLQKSVKNIDKSSITSIPFLTGAMEGIQRKVDGFIKYIIETQLETVEEEEEDLETRNEENREKIKKYDEQAQTLLKNWTEEKEGMDMWVQTNNTELKNIRKQTKDLTKIKKEKDEKKLLNQQNTEDAEQLLAHTRELKIQLTNDIEELEAALKEKRAELKNIATRAVKIEQDLENLTDESFSINQELSEIEGKLNETEDEDKKARVKCVHNWIEAVDKVMENINVHNWKEWDHERIVDWICSLNGGELESKYKDVLKENVPEYISQGKDLELLDKDFLLEMGIKRIRDRLTILEHVKLLPNVRLPDKE